MGGAIANLAAVTLKNTIVASSPAGGNCGGAITDGGGKPQLSRYHLSRHQQQPRARCPTEQRRAHPDDGARPRQLRA